MSASFRVLYIATNGADTSTEAPSWDEAICRAAERARDSDCDAEVHEVEGERIARAACVGRFGLKYMLDRRRSRAA